MISHKVLIWISYTILGVGLLQNVFYLLQVSLASVKLIIKALPQANLNSDQTLLSSSLTPGISILIPAYNEELTICNTAIIALAVQYPSFEIIIINDGSPDQTLQTLIESFELTPASPFYEPIIPHKPIRSIYKSKRHSNLIVIDKENGGRADALNAGINIAKNPLFCTVDADSFLDPSALLKTVKPFIENPEEMVATGGTVRILNGCLLEHGVIKQARLPKKWIPLFQVIEYIRAFLMGRLAWSELGIITIISGAFAIFKRSVALKVGGFSTKTIGEDFELVMKFHRYCREKKRNYQMQFVPEPVCWTEAPESLEVLKKQRIRWQQGGLEVLFKHKDMCLNPKYGRIGLVAYPIMVLFDVLGPIFELLGYLLLPIFYIIGALDPFFMIAFFSVFIGFGIFISTMSLILEEVSLKRFLHAKSLLLLGLAALLENFGYRQLNNIWRIMGWWNFLRKKQEWGNMKRVGTSRNG